MKIRSYKTHKEELIENVKLPKNPIKDKSIFHNISYYEKDPNSKNSWGDFWGREASFSVNGINLKASYDYMLKTTVEEFLEITDQAKKKLKDTSADSASQEKSSTTKTSTQEKKMNETKTPKSEDGFYVMSVGGISKIPSRERMIMRLSSVVCGRPLYIFFESIDKEQNKENLKKVSKIFKQLKSCEQTCIKAGKMDEKFECNLNKNKSSYDEIKSRESEILHSAVFWNEGKWEILNKIQLTNDIISCLTDDDIEKIFAEVEKVKKLESEKKPEDEINSSLETIKKILDDCFKNSKSPKKSHFPYFTLSDKNFSDEMLKEFSVKVNQDRNGNQNQELVDLYFVGCEPEDFANTSTDLRCLKSKEGDNAFIIFKSMAEIKDFSILKEKLKAIYEYNEEGNKYSGININSTVDVEVNDGKVISSNILESVREYGKNTKWEDYWDTPDQNLRGISKLCFLESSSIKYVVCDNCEPLDNNARIISIKRSDDIVYLFYNRLNKNLIENMKEIEKIKCAIDEIENFKAEKNIKVDKMCGLKIAELLSKGMIKSKKEFLGCLYDEALNISQGDLMELCDGESIKLLDEVYKVRPLIANYLKGEELDKKYNELKEYVTKIKDKTINTEEFSQWHKNLRQEKIKLINYKVCKDCEPLSKNAGLIAIKRGENDIVYLIYNCLEGGFNEYMKGLAKIKCAFKEIGKDIQTGEKYGSRVLDLLIYENEKVITKENFLNYVYNVRFSISHEDLMEICDNEVLIDLLNEVFELASGIINFSDKEVNKKLHNCVNLIKGKFEETAKEEIEKLQQYISKSTKKR